MLSPSSDEESDHHQSALGTEESRISIINQHCPLENDISQIPPTETTPVDPQALVGVVTDGIGLREQAVNEGDAIVSPSMDPSRALLSPRQDSSASDLDEEIRPGAVYVRDSGSFESYRSSVEESDLESLTSARQEANPDDQERAPLPVAMVAENREKNVEETVERIRRDTGAMLEVLGEDVAFAEEVGPYDSEVTPSYKIARTSQSWTKRKKMTIGLFALFVAIVAAIIVAVITAGNKGETPLVGKDPPPAELKEENKKKYDLIKEIVSRISGLSVITNETTPQHSAFIWLAENDTFDDLDLENERKVIQRYVLATLYFATNGDQWNQSYGFLSPVDECMWNDRDSDNDLLGVYRCQEGLVGELFFYSSGLSGTLPNEIGELSNLTRFQITGAPLKGIIPNSITKLKSLKDVSLSYTNMHGTIPKDIGELAQLKRIWFEFNRLSGPIPTSIGKLNALEQLRLNSNQLSGNLPESMGNLLNLKDLWLYSNKFSGVIPSTFSSLTSLKIIFLDANDFTGGMDNLCNIDFIVFEADCGVPVGQSFLKRPEVDCDCCNHCCVNGKECQLVYRW